jgi:NADPH2:quinone reductase
VSTAGHDIDPALAVAALPNAIMAHVALTRAARMSAGESVLIHGALGGFAAAFPGMARQLGASRVVGSVRREKATTLPYDALVDSAQLPDEKFDIIVDPVGGPVRTRSLELLAPLGRLLVVGNASGDWDHRIDSNAIWYGTVTVTGFSAGAYIPSHPEAIRPAADAALAMVAGGLADQRVEVLPFADAATACRSIRSCAVDGRLVLTP